MSSKLFLTLETKPSKILIFDENIWALMQEILSSGVCERQRRRQACAPAQSDQQLCYTLESNTSKLATDEMSIF